MALACARKFGEDDFRALAIAQNRCGDAGLIKKIGILAVQLQRAAQQFIELRILSVFQQRGHLLPGRVLQFVEIVEDLAANVVAFFALAWIDHQAVVLIEQRKRFGIAALARQAVWRAPG